MTTGRCYQKPFTEQLLVDAGIARGMSVLDLGCGRGEVSCLVAELVGDKGRVLGVDRDGLALAKARENTESKGFSNVTFVQQDLSKPLSGAHAFDAVVARRVLMYLPRPVDVLRRMGTSLRVGGIAVFEEADATMTPGRRGAYPLHDQVNDWAWRTVVSEGANIHMGFELPKMLEQAGFKVEHVRAAAEIEYGPNQSMYAIVRAMLTRIVQHGVATEAEIDIETLEDRLAAERTGACSIYVRNMSFGVFARKE